MLNYCGNADLNPHPHIWFDHEVEHPNIRCGLFVVGCSNYKENAILVVGGCWLGSYMQSLWSRQSNYMYHRYTETNIRRSTFLREQAKVP